MMFVVKITYKGMFPLASRSERTAMLRHVYEAGGEFFHKHFTDIHFLNSATTRYGYRLRQGERGTGTKFFKKSYTGRKLAKWGHTRPLEWSGVTRARATVPDVRATGKGFKLVSHVNILNYKPWLFEEFCRTTPDEIEQMVGEMNRDLHEQAVNFKSFKQEVIRA
jgi:hypothetical protein